MSLAVQLGPLALKNPITTASGTFGYGLEFTDFVDLAAIGGLCTKGLSLRPHAGNPPPRRGGRYFLFLKLVTDYGIEGVGECYAASFGPRVFEPFARDVFEKHVLGADPFKIEAIWRNVYGRGYSMRPDISLLGVLSGIEMALWDIVG